MRRVWASMGLRRIAKYEEGEGLCCHVGGEEGPDVYKVALPPKW
jgi:hypothetical protein